MMQESQVEYFRIHEEEIRVYLSKAYAIVNALGKVKVYDDIRDILSIAAGHESRKASIDYLESIHGQCVGYLEGLAHKGELDDFFSRIGLGAASSEDTEETSKREEVQNSVELLKDAIDRLGGVR